MNEVVKVKAVSTFASGAHTYKKGAVVNIPADEFEPLMQAGFVTKSTSTLTNKDGSPITAEQKAEEAEAEESAPETKAVTAPQSTANRGNAPRNK